MGKAIKKLAAAAYLLALLPAILIGFITASLVGAFISGWKVCTDFLADGLTAWLHGRDWE